MILLLSDVNAGNARSNKRVTESILIGNLVSREDRPGACSESFAREGQAIARCGVATGAVIFSSRQLLATLIELGEDAHARRDRAALEWVARAILELPLGRLSQAVGSYYAGLSLCRGGRPAWNDARRIFDWVIETAPPLFQAKALVAQGTSLLVWGGNIQSATALHDEALRIADKCGAAGIDILLHVGNSRVMVEAAEGRNATALAMTENLRPAATAVAERSPVLFQIYQNNLAALLAKNGRLREAKAVADSLRRSPLIGVYQEWSDTCADIDERTRPATKAFVIGGLSASPDSKPVDERGTTNADMAVESARSAARSSIAICEPDFGTAVVRKAREIPKQKLALARARRASRAARRRWRRLPRRQSCSPVFSEFHKKSSPTVNRAIRLDDVCRPLGWVYAQFPPTRAP